MYPINVYYEFIHTLIAPRSGIMPLTKVILTFYKTRFLSFKLNFVAVTLGQIQPS